MLTEPGRYDYLPLIDRPIIRWPENARVAFWVAPNIEFYEIDPPDGQGRPLWPRPYPDVLNYSLRDYGNRAGVYRVMEALERFGVRASVSLNAAICDHMPDIGDECIRLKWELFSHGVYNTRLIAGMSEDEVRHMIGDSVATIKRHSGQDVVGWLAPALSATETFFDLLPEFGIKYTIDMVPDDQPIPIKVRQGRLISIPYSTEINDIRVMGVRGYPADKWAAMIKACFDQLYREGAGSRIASPLSTTCCDMSHLIAASGSRPPAKLPTGIINITTTRLFALGLRATAAVNAVVATHYPRIIQEIVRRNWEIVANGIDMGHVHHGKLELEKERELIQRARDTLSKSSGKRIAGWHSPGHSESTNTLALLAENAFEYVADWANDDLPYMMKTAAGPLCAMPLTHEWTPSQSGTKLAWRLFRYSKIKRRLPKSKRPLRPKTLCHLKETS